MVRGGFILDSVQNCSCVRAMLFRNTVSIGCFTAAWLAQLGKRRSSGGGGEDEVLSTVMEVGDKRRQAAVCRILRGWGLRSKYRKQQRGAGHCKGRGKQKEKHQCAMFWPGLICASEDTNRVLSTAKGKRNRRTCCSFRFVL